MLKNLLEILNKIYPFADFLYLLQLEEYDTRRYFLDLKRFFWRRDLQKKDILKLTSRTKLLMIVSLVPSILVPILTPIFIGMANLILSPIVELAKVWIEWRASTFFAKTNKKTKVIAIAGSFGKTTTKNFIYQMVKYNYKTQMVPGNVNTPTGIANYILNSFDPTNELLIVEVDTYKVGEIGRSLKITPPDISILTNVGDQHLERFGTKDNLKKALSEVFDYSKTGAIKIRAKKDNLDYALEVAKILKIPKDVVRDTVKKLKLPDRRGNLIKVGNIDVFDNSYNISFLTASHNLAIASKKARQSSRKLVVITAGIPELGSENANSNYLLGRKIDQVANKIILLRSILSGDVYSGIKNKSKVVWFDTMSQALVYLENIDGDKYLGVMFPELNDLYY